MTMGAMPWIALASLQPNRCHQLAWFVYGSIEREHVLNVTSCADWWMRAIGISAGQFKAPRHGLGIALPPVEPRVSIHEDGQAETSWHRSPTQFESLS